MIVDYYPRWLEAILLKKTNAQHMVKSMEAIFRTHGLPALRSDNRPPFASKEFEGFLKYLGISHKKGVPYWPQSNGEVERGNETILKIARIARLEGKDWRKALENFLFQLPRILLLECHLQNYWWGENCVTSFLELNSPKTVQQNPQKEYADTTQGAKHSNIEEGDKVLLKQTREKQLSPNYEPESYIVTRKDGNAVILQDTNGNNKTRNIAHMKKFVDPGTVDKGEIDP